LTPGAFSTPLTGKKVYGMNTRSVGRSRPKFKTPFKAGLAPGESGRLELERMAIEKTKTALANALKPTKAQTAEAEAKKSGHVAFNLSRSYTFSRVTNRLIPTNQRNHKNVKIYATTPNLNDVPVPSCLY
jgi:hypothetical protein